MQNRPSPLAHNHPLNLVSVDEWIDDLFFLTPEYNILRPFPFCCSVHKFFQDQLINDIDEDIFLFVFLLVFQPLLGSRFLTNKFCMDYKCPCQIFQRIIFENKELPFENLLH